MDLRFFRRIFIVFTVVQLGCQSSPDFEALKSEIVALHKTEIDAHWKKDIDFFVRNISEDYMAVSNGEVQRPALEDIRSRFSNYLNNTTFTEYRDVAEPIIGFSKDGSLAWAILQIKVVGKRTLDDGSVRDLDFTCAWLTLYERQDNTWMRLTDVSTFK
jgi:hypothetical protein